MDAAELLARKQLREASISISVDGDGGTAELKLRAIPRRQYRDLQEAHPPVAEGEAWNIDTFAPALISACVVEPAFTLEQATELWEEWEAAEVGRLFLLAWQLNENTSSVSFTLPGFGKTTGSGQKSATATTRASRTASS